MQKRKKLIKTTIGCVLITVLMLAMNVSSIGVELNKDAKPIKDSSERFTQCYVEISGIMHNDWPATVKLANHWWFWHIERNDEYFISYGYTLFEPDVEITIYDTKGGSVLWEYTSNIDPLVSFIGFKGDFSYTDNSPYLPQITYEGTVLMINILLKNFG
jgi:hypothetical protein